MKNKIKHGQFQNMHMNQNPVVESNKLEHIKNNISITSSFM